MVNSMALLRSRLCMHHGGGPPEPNPRCRQVCIKSSISGHGTMAERVHNEAQPGGSGSSASRLQHATSHAKSNTACVNRRAVLAGLLLASAMPVADACAEALAANPGAATANAAEGRGLLIKPGEVSRLLEGASSILPALTAPQYVATIKINKPRAFSELRELADRGKFKAMSEALSYGAFDAVYQSCFFLPWALLRVDVGTAEAVNDAYLGFLLQLKAFDTLCIAAARNQVDDEEVEAGLLALEAAVERVLQAAATAVS